MLIITVIGGLEETVRLCKVVSDSMLLRALSKIIVTMVPNPAELIVSNLYYDHYYIL